MEKSRGERSGYEDTSKFFVIFIKLIPKGWRKELNLISWNNGNPKYDIRDWAPDHEKMGKGITLTEAKAKV